MATFAIPSPSRKTLELAFDVLESAESEEEEESTRWSPISFFMKGAVEGIRAV